MSLFQTDYCFVCDEPVIPAFKWEAIFFGLPKKRICEKCEKQFHRVTPPTCPVCSRPLKKLEPRFIKDGFCTDCHRWESSSKWKGVLQKNISLFEYNDFFAEILAKFKYRGDYAIAQIFADDLRQVLSKLTYDVLVPIPLSNERLYERGFNQAERWLLKRRRQSSGSLHESIQKNNQRKKEQNESIWNRYFKWQTPPSI